MIGGVALAAIVLSLGVGFVIARARVRPAGAGVNAQPRGDGNHPDHVSSTAGGSGTASMITRTERPDARAVEALPAAKIPPDRCGATRTARLSYAERTCYLGILRGFSEGRAPDADAVHSAAERLALEPIPASSASGTRTAYSASGSVNATS